MVLCGTCLVLDIPIGPTAKVRSMPEAQRLRRLFEYVASRIRLSLDVVITDGRQRRFCDSTRHSGLWPGPCQNERHHGRPGCQGV